MLWATQPKLVYLLFDVYLGLDANVSARYRVPKRTGVCGWGKGGEGHTQYNFPAFILWRLARSSYGSSKEKSD